MHGRQPPPWRTLRLLWLSLPLAGAGHPVVAQESMGSPEAAVAGAALGLYTGAALGGMASLIPCNQTYAGVRCVRLGAALGAGIGLASGIAMGDADAELVRRAYRRAGFGLAAGSLVVVALKPVLDRWSWSDVAAGAVIGSALGAGGSGAWAGLAIGSAIGVAAWRAFPSVDLPDAVAVGLLGMAGGAFVTWIVRAADAGDGGGDGPALSFRVSVP